jgi:hypothetical protein
LTTTNPSTRHVQQVAELVKRLNRDELRELLQLVPRLQTEAAALNQPDELVAWVREQLAQYATVARPMQEDDLFLANQTVAEYFALAEAERERIWTELYTAAIESAPEREIRPDAAVSA